MRTLLLFVLCAAPAFAAQLTRGPFLQLANDTGITVVFNTDVASTATVHFGLVGQALDGSVDDVVPTTHHVVRLSGLTPFTEYAYEVVVDGVPLAGGEELRFRTYPSPGTSAPFRLFAWGDSGLGNAAQLAVAGQLAQQSGEATLSLILGDIIYPSGTPDLYDDRFFAPYAPLLRRMVVWPTIGNHDVSFDPTGGPYLDAFELPKNNPAGTELYYSFDYGDAHFICLDTHVSGHAPGAAQLAWAQADLAASTAKWKIAFFHVPPYSGGTHLDDAVVRSGIVPVLEAAGVDLVFAGHSHVYERTYLLQNETIVQRDRARYQKLTPGAGTLYVVSGTGGQVGGLQNPTHPLMAFQAAGFAGASVLDVKGDTARGFFLAGDGTVVDLFELSKGPDVTGPRISGARMLSSGFFEVAFDEPVVGATSTATWELPPGFSLVSGPFLSSRVVVNGPPSWSGPFTLRALNLKDAAGNVTPASEWPFEVRQLTRADTPQLRYAATATGLPADWMQPGFDDSSWAIGQSLIGTDVGELGTKVNLSDAATLYTRRHFTAGLPLTSYREVALELNYQDGFVAYLNGVEVARQNVPMGQRFMTFANGGRTPNLIERRRVALDPRTALRAGDNVLAVEVHRVGTASPLQLKAEVILEAGAVPPAPGKLDGGGCSCAVPGPWSLLALAVLWLRRR